MQKLIILDSETGICYIYNLDDLYDTTDLTEVVEELGYNSNSCQWMVALEINDTTK